jgi:hypothetical protein
MKSGWRNPMVAVLVCAAVLAGLAVLAGCGGNGQPKVMVFMGKSSKSYDTMKQVIDSLQNKYKGKVTFVIVDYDDPKNKGELDKYHVTMNPTTILFSAKGKITNQYLGAAREDMIAPDILSLIPGKQTSPSTQPGGVTTPATPVPQQGSPSSLPSSVPGATTQ